MGFRRCVQRHFNLARNLLKFDSIRTTMENLERVEKSPDIFWTTA
jgi:hypothetical protein